MKILMTCTLDKNINIIITLCGISLLQLIKSDLDGTIGAIEDKLDERALLRQKKVQCNISLTLEVEQSKVRHL